MRQIQPLPIPTESESDKHKGDDKMPFVPGFGIFRYQVKEKKEEKEVTTQEEHAKKVPAEDFMKCFAERNFWLMVFLENVVERTDPEDLSKIPPIIYNTLLELYLEFRDKMQKKGQKERRSSFNIQPYIDPTDETIEYDTRYSIFPPTREIYALSNEEKALNLLQKQDANLDYEHAIAITQFKDFPEGTLYLYRKLGQSVF